MPSILKIKEKYHIQIDPIDLDVLIGYVTKKSREFILSHPEFNLTTLQTEKLAPLIERRTKNEPLAHILGTKEFYGLNFKVNKHTLIPRPETELIIDMALEEIFNIQHPILNIIDIGTGSGNIIISITNQLKLTPYQLLATNYFAIDISKEALKIAKKNARANSLSKKIKFLHGNLLKPLIKNYPKLSQQKATLIILANLPYLSKEIYNNCPPTVKKYEPRSALFSPQDGLSHYEKLLRQIKSASLEKNNEIILFFEISPEQKKIIASIIKKHFPQARIKFQKDLAQKWRICEIKL